MQLTRKIPALPFVYTFAAGAVAGEDVVCVLKSNADLNVQDVLSFS